MNTMLFDDITVLRADGTVLPHQFVSVRDGRFDYIGTTRPAGAFDRVIPGSRFVLMPGLVNAHTHVPMTLMRGYGDDMPLQSWLFDRIFPFEDQLSGDAVYWGSLLGIAEMLATGTTSFSDMYYFCDRIADAVEQSGIKANIGRGISCFDESQRFADLPAYRELVELLEQRQGAADDRIRIDVAPHSEYTTRPDILEDATALAARYGARMQVHVSETKSEHKECVGRHGKTPVRVLLDAGVLDQPVTIAHGVWLTDEDMDILAAQGATVAHCAKSNLKLASGIAQVTKWQKKGLSVAIGTDSAASNNRLDMLEEMRTASLLAKGVSLDPCALPADQVLYMATRAGALSQGRTDTGDIVPGYCADAVLLDGENWSMSPCHSALSNAVFAAAGQAVYMTMVDGRVVYENGEFPTLDMPRIRAESDRCIREILQKLD